MRKELLYIVLLSSVLISAQYTDSNSDYDESQLGGFLSDKNIYSILDNFTWKALYSWPFATVVKGISMICKMFVSDSGESNIDISKLMFIHKRPEGTTTYPVTNANNLWKLLAKDRKQIVIFCVGWRSDPKESSTVDVMWNAFKTRSDVNFVLVDVSIHLKEFYNWAAVKTNPIGQVIGNSLADLAKISNMRKVDSIHLIGHSLGAHVMGAAGRQFAKITGQPVARITGLDPAKPCYQGNRALTILTSSDAQIVDIIHSNVDILGKIDPMGDLDFYTAGLQNIQPGCILSTCSHTRAVVYFAESVYQKQEMNFLGYQCNSFNDLKKGKCDSSKSTTMGYKIDTKKRGIFMVNVNSKSPYGTNAKKRLNSVVINIFLPE